MIEAAVGFLLMILGFVVALAVYFAPALVAHARDHKNTVAIFFLDLFAGWTFVGWVGALVWALVKE